YLFFSLFFFNASSTSAIYTLSLHDALPIWHLLGRPPDRRPDALGRLRLERGLERDLLEAARFRQAAGRRPRRARPGQAQADVPRDRKSTRLNSSHDQISYAVFCLKKKKKKQ